MTQIRYLVLGSGMQGCAAGYYLAQFGSAKEIIFADLHEEIAAKAAQRVNAILGKNLCQHQQINAKNYGALVTLMKRVDAVMSATDYSLNLQITQAAIEAGVHLVDLGGNTDVVKKQLELSSLAKEKNISIVPDCGLAPGLGNTLAAFGLEELDECESIQVRCGGLPQTPRGPLQYKLVFNIRGLTNEYFGKAWAIRNEKLIEIDTFSENEEIEFKAPVGKCEAFVTSGGTSTAPWSFLGKVKDFDYKTVRYPGHYEKMKCILDLGLLETTPIEIGETLVAPREVFHAVASRSLDFPEDKDLVVLRATCRGRKNNQDVRWQFDLLDFQDEKTGFSAMERTTGFPAALVLIYAARGEALKGVVPLETAIPNKKYLKELVDNGLQIEGLPL